MFEFLPTFFGRILSIVFDLSSAQGVERPVNLVFSFLLLHASGDTLLLTTGGNCDSIHSLLGFTSFVKNCAPAITLLEAESPDEHISREMSVG
jgi:hypothetical protein